MRHTLFAAGVAVLVCGCGGGPDSPADPVATAIAPAASPAPEVKAGPKVGDKVVFPKLADAYSDAESIREASRLDEEAERNRKPGQPIDLGEAGRALSKKRIGQVWFDDLVEILEVGSDYAVVSVIRTKGGEPGKVHGYVKRWW